VSFPSSSVQKRNTGPPHFANFSILPKGALVTCGEPQQSSCGQGEKISVGSQLYATSPSTIGSYTSPKNKSWRDLGLL